MQRITRFVTLVMVLMLLTSGLQAAPVAPVSPSDSSAATLQAASAASAALAAPFVETPCFSGAVPPTGSLCLVVPVQTQDGTQVHGAIVEAEYNGHTLSTPTEQPVNLPITQPVATFDVSRIGVRPTDLLTVTAAYGGNERTALVSFNPEKANRTHVTEPIIVDGPTPAQLAHAPLWGKVYRVGNPKPISNATVNLFAGDTLIDSDVTDVTQGVSPTYELDPGTHPAGTPFTLQASDGTLTQTIHLTWQRIQLEVPIVLGLSCIGDISGGTAGGSTGLPPTFCLSGRVLGANGPVDGAEVSIDIPGRQSILITSATLDALGPGAFSVNIGPFVEGLSPETVIRVSATKDGKSGFIKRTKGELNVDKDWESAVVAIQLVNQYTPVVGLQGGTARVLQAVKDTTYAASPDGGGVLGQYVAGRFWLPLTGGGDGLFGPPEVTALLAIPDAESGDDWLIAGARDGTLNLSLNSGRTWIQKNEPFTQPIVALTGDASRIYGVAGTQFFTGQIVTSVPTLTITPGLTLPFTATSLAVHDDALLAGATDGLYRSTDAGATWTHLRTEAVTALAVVPQTDEVLAGTGAGLFVTDALGGVWATTVITESVYAVAHVQGTYNDVRIATESGIYESGGNRNDWTRSTNSETSYADPTSPTTITLGTPDVFDITQGLSNTLLAATSTGVYTSTDGGASWNTVQPSVPELPVRSVTQLADGIILALTADQLWRWQNGVWQPINGLPAALNGAVVRVNGSGHIALGRNAGPGASLYLSSDNGATWTAHTLGFDRGVTGMAFFETPRDNGVVAIITTDGDGVWGWRPAATPALVALPAISANARITALTLDERATTCQIIVAVMGDPARIVARPCNTSQAWLADQSLPQIDGRNIRFVQSLTVFDTGNVVAATTAAILRGTPGSIWRIVDGLPMRPMALSVAQEAKDTHTVALGGLAAGILLLNDTEPDLAVTIVATDTIKAGELLTATVTVRNQGVVPVNPGTLTLGVEPSTLIITPNSVSVPRLTAGHSYSVVVSVTVPLDTRPVSAIITAKIPNVPAEAFTTNNTATSISRVLYRDGSDATVTLTGQSKATAGEPTTVRLSVSNAGNQPTEPGTLTLIVPADLALTADPSPDSANGTQWQWNVPPLEARNSDDYTLFEITLTYTLPVPADPATTFPLAASIAGGDDREPGNNDGSLTLGYQPTTPTEIVVINRSRMAQAGDVDADFDAALAQYLQQPGRFELAVDGYCTDQLPSIDDLYEEFDAANNAVADEQNAIITKQFTDDARTALTRAREARKNLTTAIQQCIVATAQQFEPQPEYLYIIGGDGVVPSFAHDDPLQGNQGLLAEHTRLDELEPDDSLYAVLANNQYVSDEAYQYPATTMATHIQFMFGRQPGSAQAIASVLRTYITTEGILTLDTGLVAGSAVKLTENTQSAACQQMVARNLPAPECGSIAPDVQQAFNALQKNTLTSFSGHGTQNQINDLHSRQIVLRTNLDGLNLLLLLACHSGLATAPNVYGDPSLSEAFALHGQPLFGYTGYAYASDSDVLGNGQAFLTPNQAAYAERLHLLLIQELLKGGTLGNVQQRALAAYGKRVNDDSLDRKTRQTLVLYGPPMYSAVVPGAVQPAPPPRLATPGGSGYITSTNTFTDTETPDGIFYSVLPFLEGRAGVTVTPLIQQAVGSTIQPALLFDLPFTATAAQQYTVKLLYPSTYRKISGIDPVIPRIAPLSTPGLYEEPGYGGQAVDWADQLQTTTDSNGQMSALVAVGQWRPENGVQLLYDQVRLVIFPRDSVVHKPSGFKADVKLCRAAPDMLSVSATFGQYNGRVGAVEVERNAGATRITEAAHQQSGRWWVTVPARDDVAYTLRVVSFDGDLFHEAPLSSTNITAPCP